MEPLTHFLGICPCGHTHADVRDAVVVGGGLFSGLLLTLRFGRYRIKDFVNHAKDRVSRVRCPKFLSRNYMRRK